MDTLTTSGSTRSRWRQATLWCDDWQAAEQVAGTHLAPRLTGAEHDGILTSWWFTRKGPAWHLRVLPAPDQDEHATAVLHRVMSDLRTRRLMLRWAATHYEPEIHAFGGAVAMDLAHDLFHADSRHLLDHLHQARPDHQPHPDHRRELGLLLCGALMRAAGQDWYEQGDIWAQVAAHRTTGHPPAVRPGTRTAVRRLITANPAPGEHSPTRPTWLAAFQRTGRDLADLAQQGILSRGLRAVLAHHVLFAWNRAGIPGPQQALLAATASDAVFHHEPVRTGPVPGCAMTPSV
ncbi:thiopeptide-type bacteriocin biosynthesis protein [Frankia sp. Cj3]|uniref:thiopeptide-type bacteriocin biosynthesis protein n=1 Tax=Frankia sp. Cj3 TaxID=2880976 RepID=UPI001EF60B84|nr:thiopeptide-type bacteriocin biosynthesis protein [Frankia sp. Cj3]